VGTSLRVQQVRVLLFEPPRAQHRIHRVANGWIPWRHLRGVPGGISGPDNESPWPIRRGTNELSTLVALDEPVLKGKGRIPGTHRLQGTGECLEYYEVSS
jgi:hypothetical protein